MRIIHKVTLEKEQDKNNKIKNLLKEKNIRYEEKSFFIFFYYYEDDINSKLLQEIVKKYNCLDMIDTEFEKNDIIEAKWLRIRSKWYWEYPQPEEGEKNFLNVSFNLNNYCEICGIGREQKSSILIKSEPIWGKKHFLHINWIHDELFCKSEIWDIISKSNLSGIGNKSVIQYKTGKELQSIKQLEIKTILKEGLLTNENIIPLKCNIESSKSESMPCGKVKYLHNRRGMLCFKKEIFEGIPDFVKTFEYFGDGALATRFIIISKKASDLFLKNKWKDIAFEPIELV